MLLNAILTALLGEALELLLSPLPSPASFLFYLEPNRFVEQKTKLVFPRKETAQKFVYQASKSKVV